MPEQFAFDQVGGQRGAIDPEISTAAARRQTVNSAGDQFLASPAFTHDDHWGFGRRHLADHLHHLLDRGGLPDDWFFARLLPGMGARHSRQSLLSPAQQDPELIRLNGLFKIVLGAQFDRADGVGDAALAGDDEGRNRELPGADFAQHRQPVRLGHLDVEQHDVGPVGIEHFAGLQAVDCLRDLEAPTQQKLLQQPPHRRVIFRDQNPLAFGHVCCQRPGAWPAAAIRWMECSCPPPYRLDAMPHLSKPYAMQSPHENTRVLRTLPPTHSAWRVRSAA